MKSSTYFLTALLLCVAFTGSISANDHKKITASIHNASRFLSATGLVIAADIVGNTITIEGKGKKKPQWTFSVPTTAKISQGKKTITLGDIISGSTVAVKYNKDGDTLNATSIRLVPTKSPRKK